jgi:FkbM family methyltransferase
MDYLKSIFKDQIIKLFSKRKHNIYPYIYNLDEPSLHSSDIKFVINNPIEAFRICQWGGERDYVLSMLNSLKKDDIFLDIGSSVGLISVLAAKILDDGIVISIEPEPENAKSLVNNYSINSLVNFKILQIAVGDIRTKMDLFSSGSNSFSPSLKQVNGINRTITVCVDTVDNLIDRNLIPIPTVIKIDIEGAEMMALKGMGNLLNSNNRPRLIYLEIHPGFLSEFNTNTNEILNFVELANYKVIERINRDDQILCKLILFP